MPTHDELDWNVSPGPRKKKAGDINTPSYGPQRKKESRDDNPNSTGVESTTGIEPEKTPDPEIRFVSAQFEPHPMNGYEPNKKCFVTGKAEFLTRTSRTKCTLELFATYSDREENLCLPEEKYGTAFIEQDGSFKFKAVPLYIPAGYPSTNGFSEKISYRGCISAQRHEQPWDFFLDLPDETVEKPPILKRGMHDDKAVEKYPSKYSTSGRTSRCIPAKEQGR